MATLLALPLEPLAVTVGRSLLLQFRASALTLRNSSRLVFDHNGFNGIDDRAG